jgi:mannose-6-phosphate isomerase-like protein (cupin superfamily)
MKRSNFILTSLLALPTWSFAKPVRYFKRSKPFKVDAGKDRFSDDFVYRGNHFLLKVSGKDTDGDLCIYDTTRVKKGGPRLHLHHSQDEWFFVLKGEFTFKVGDETYYLKEGDTLFGPREIPHAFALTSEGEGRLLLTYQPAGSMEDFFREARAMTNPTEEQSKNLFKKHGMELLGSPID